MFVSPSSLISVMFFCSLLIVIISFYLHNVDRMIQIGIGSVFILIGFVVIRLVFPFEFTFSNAYASRYIMPNLLNMLHTPIISVFDKYFTLLHILISVWVLGIILAAADTIKTHLRFGQVLKQMPVLQDKAVNQILHTITQDYRKPVPFQVLHSNLISTPLLYHFRRPKIIVPTIDLTYKEWYFILKHEITHYYNRDLQIKMFVQLLRIIYWWNPFVYLLNAEIDKMLEIRADLEVTKNLNEHDKTKYLYCLLKVAKTLSPDRYNHYTVAFDSGKTIVLSQRFHLILGRYKNPKNKYLKTILMIIPFVLLLYFSLFIVIEPYAIPPEHAADTVELTEDTSYLVLNPTGGYDVYIDGSYFATVQEIKDSYSNLTVYQSLEEVKNHEIHKDE